MGRYLHYRELNLKYHQLRSFSRFSKWEASVLRCIIPCEYEAVF